MKITHLAIWGPSVVCGLILSCFMHFFITLFFIFSFYLPLNSYRLLNLIPILYKITRFVILRTLCFIKYIRKTSWQIVRKQSIRATSDYGSAGATTPNIDDPEYDVQLALAAARRLQELATNMPAESVELNSSGNSSHSSTEISNRSKYLSHLWFYIKKPFQKNYDDDDDPSPTPPVSPTELQDYIASEYDNLEPPPSAFYETITTLRQIMAVQIRIIQFILRVPPLSLVVKRLSTAVDARRKSLERRRDDFYQNVRKTLYIQELQNHAQRATCTYKAMTSRLKSDYHRIKARVEMEESGDTTQAETRPYRTRSPSLTSESTPDEYVTPPETPQVKLPETSIEFDYDVYHDAIDSVLKPKLLAYLSRKVDYIRNKMRPVGRYLWTLLLKLRLILNFQNMKKFFGVVQREVSDKLDSILTWRLRIVVNKDAQKQEILRLDLTSNKKIKLKAFSQQISSSNEEFLTPENSPPRELTLLKVPSARKKNPNPDNGFGQDSSFESVVDTSSENVMDKQ